MKRIILSLLLLAGFASSQAQEAFYIYRNDGDFNGFFFDEVTRMGYSKFDLDSIEHDVYVVQEIETEDSIYRIPLAAIDSIGFQQPEIILNERFVNLDARYRDPENFPYDPYMDINISHLDPYVIHWQCAYDYSGKIYNDNLPRVGDVLYSHLWALGVFNNEYGRYEGGIDGPFVGKVREVIPDPDYDDDDWRWLIYCDPIDDISDVFEQFITVEQLSRNSDGIYYVKTAGMNKILRRVEGNKELTIVNLNGRFPFSRSEDNWEMSLGLDLSLAVKARMTYKLSRKDFYVNVKFEEDANVGTDFSVKGTIHETTTWQIAKFPIYVPSFLPLFEINPAPGSFFKTSADVNMKISSPHFGFHAEQTVTITGDGVTGGSSSKCILADDGWGLELSLNGSVHTGMYFPFNIETNTWAKKIAWCSTGVDLYVGPKLSSSFTLDPVALAQNQNIYSTFKNTKISLTGATAALEGTAKFSAKGKKETSHKIFEAEENFVEQSLNLFPSFDPSDVEVKDNTISRLVPAQYVEKTIKPRGYCLPWYVGMGAYDKDGNLVSKWYNYSSGNDETRAKYSAFNQFTEVNGALQLYDGEYKIVPLIDVLDYDVPVWDLAKTVTAKLGLYADWYYEDGNMFYSVGRTNTVTNLPGYDSGYIMLYGLLPGDKVYCEAENYEIAGVLFDGDKGISYDTDGEPEEDVGPLRRLKIKWKYTPKKSSNGNQYLGGTQPTLITVFRANGSKVEFKSNTPYVYAQD